MLPTSETHLVSTPKIAVEIPARRPSEAHRALSNARALSAATSYFFSDGCFAGGGNVWSSKLLYTRGENDNAPCLGFRRRFFLLVFPFVVVVGGYYRQSLRELKKDGLSASGNVRVCLVGTATPFDEPCGPICKADFVGRLLCCACCCCRRIRIVRADVRLAGGRIVVVVVGE